jgi:hypothetical protein
MAEERLEPRDINFRQWLPWTQLFRGFWVALDPKKLMLAAMGIVVMAVGWWLWSWVFFSTTHKPEWPSEDYAPAAQEGKTAPGVSTEEAAWQLFKRDRNAWNLLYETAGNYPEVTDAGDLAQSPQEYNAIKDKIGPNPQPNQVFTLGGQTFVVREKSYGMLRTWPWFENRGPNPYLLVTGQAGQRDPADSAHYLPWRRGEFFDWMAGEAVVLLEPLAKLLAPVRYFFDDRARIREHIYLLLVLIWTVGTWAFFGGAITRIAVVEVARNEKPGLTEALRYTCSRWRSYLFASFLPLIGIAAVTILLGLFGLADYVPWLKEVWFGLLWPVALGFGLAMAILLVGLVGWPMIQATLSAEGSDSFDAISRSYSYVLQKPWSYLWYAVVALAYGAVVVFFVGLMGSLMVYLSKWGVRQTAWASYSDPSYLFVFAPTSFQWRDLLLQGSPVAGHSAVVTDAAIQNYIQSEEFKPWNYVGAGLVGLWLYLFFLLIIGFGYSYFWSASSIIYLLMRRKVDDTEMDEVYLEEEDADESYSTPETAATPAAPAAHGTQPLQMVEAPTLRQPTAAAAPASATVEAAAPKPGDGEVTTGETVP